MRKIAVIFIFVMLAVATACSPKENNSATLTTKEIAVSPIYANKIENGTYEISVESSSSMFRVVNCQLIVKDEEMNAVMTMSGQGYGMVYMGTGEQALSDSENKYIPFALNENGEKTFTVPVKALNIEIDCAAWSIKKEKWYDRTLIFKSDAIPSHALDLE